MGAAEVKGAFVMPMMRRFVPRRVQPWLYVVLALTFQLSGGLYMGSMNWMMGGTAWMREDLLMCLYANLAGMAVWFPMLFRMKFRFTNKTLLCGAAAGVMVCNVAAPYVSWLPLLWVLCFVEGICKIQGTFECMSTIQLWMTPKRDFTVFFPWLHVIILGSMQLSDWGAAVLAYRFHWSQMHWAVAGVMMVDLLLLTVCTRHFRVVKKLPLYGVDWLGGLLWAVLLLEVAFFCCYGDYYDWLVSVPMRVLAGCIGLTLCVCVGRMCHVRHAYLEREMWSYRHLVPVLLLIFVVEVLFSTERVLEEAYLGEVMGYAEMVSVRLDGAVLAGSVAGCVFAWWWMHVRRWGYLRLLAVGLCVLSAYLLGYYVLMTPGLSLGQLWVPTACRGFAYAVLSVTFMVCLEEVMSFRHFFQALSVFNMLHMVGGGVVGSALLGEGMRRAVAGGVARVSGWVDRAGVVPGVGEGAVADGFMRQMSEAGLKQMYGWALYASVALLLLLLLYDAPVRRGLKLMPLWTRLRREAEG